MNFVKINCTDVANGPGIRVSLFVSGCRRNCPGCFNYMAFDFKYGKQFTDKIIDNIIESVNKPYITGLSILGGDPMEPENTAGILKLLIKFRDKFGYKDKTVWLWTGFTIDELMFSEHKTIYKNIIERCDCIIDGRWDEKLKDLSKRFRGSSNQHIYKVNQSSDLNKRYELTIIDDEIDNY